MADVTDAWTEPADGVPTDDISPDHDPDVVATDDSSPDQEEDGIPDEPEVFVEEIEAEAFHGDESQGAADLPETGDPRVDEVLGKLAGIEHRPTGEHVGVYDEVHRGLQDALANLDQG